jgi:hypothetical protein
MAKMAWFKFYPSDWLSDSKVLACPWEARAFWMALLCHMQQCEPRGYLATSDGKPWSLEEVASRVGCSKLFAKKMQNILEKNGVFSRNQDGVIFSRRIVADAAKTLKAQERGKLGGNPALKLVINRQDKPQNPDTRNHNIQSLSEGGLIEEFEAAEKRLKEAYPSKAGATDLVGEFRRELTEAVRPHAPPTDATFAPIADLISSGMHPITDILRPARNRARALPENYAITSWNYYATVVINQSNGRAAS